MRELDVKAVLAHAQAVAPAALPQLNTSAGAC
jgi:hypothetical protein